MYIASDRQNKLKETYFDYYDMDFKHLDSSNGHPNSGMNYSAIHRPSFLGGDENLS